METQMLAVTRKLSGIKVAAVRVSKWKCAKKVRNGGGSNGDVYSIQELDGENW